MYIYIYIHNIKLKMNTKPYIWCWTHQVQGFSLVLNHAAMAQIQAKPEELNPFGDYYRKHILKVLPPRRAPVGPAILAKLVKLGGGPLLCVSDFPLYVLFSEISDWRNLMHFFCVVGSNLFFFKFCVGDDEPSWLPVAIFTWLRLLQLLGERWWLAD